MGTPYTTSVSAMALYLMAVSAVCAYPATPTTGSKAGDLCRPRTIFCADGDGVSPRYLKCIQGQLVEEICPRDSICIGSKDTTVFCAVDMVANSSDAALTPSSTLVSSTTTMVIHASFGSEHAWSSDIHITSSAAKTGAAPAAMYPSHATSVGHNFPDNKPSSSQPRPVQITTDHALGREQSRPPLHHHFSDSLQEHRQHQQTLASSVPTPISMHRSPASAAPIIPHHTLPLPPALSYNRQKLPAVTTEILSRPLSALTTPHVTAISSAVLPIHVQSRARENPKKLNSQVHTPLLITEPAVSDSSDKIGDLSAEQIISVIGNVLISQRVDSALGDEGEVDSVAPTEADQDQTMLPVQPETKETSLEPGVTDDPNDISNNSDNSSQSETLATSIKDQQAAAFYTPLSTPAICAPGHFVCEAPGLRAGYFACDSAGVALPAVCGAKEVCYQLEKSILCDAPKV